MDRGGENKEEDGVVGGRKKFMETLEKVTLLYLGNGKGHGKGMEA